MGRKIKIIYFDARARAEIPRLVLAAAKQEWEDVYIPSAEWPTVKPTTPFGSLPVLDIDGQQFGQGLAIATYLASEFGLNGSNNLERLKIDQLAQLREDLFILESQHFRDKDPATKEEKRKALEEVHYPRYMGYFSKILKDNGGQWAVGNKLSLADVILYAGTQTLLQNNPAILDRYPELKAHRDKLAQIDGIKQHLATRHHSVI